MHISFLPANFLLSAPPHPGPSLQPRLLPFSSQSSFPPRCRQPGPSAGWAPASAAAGGVGTAPPSLCPGPVQAAGSIPASGAELATPRRGSRKDRTPVTGPSRTGRAKRSEPLGSGAQTPRRGGSGGGRCPFPGLHPPAPGMTQRLPRTQLSPPVLAASAAGHRPAGSPRQRIAAGRRGPLGSRPEPVAHGGPVWGAGLGA